MRRSFTEWCPGQQRSRCAVGHGPFPRKVCRQCSRPDVMYIHHCEVCFLHYRRCHPDCRRLTIGVPSLTNWPSLRSPSCTHHAPRVHSKAFSRVGMAPRLRRRWRCMSGALRCPLQQWCDGTPDPSMCLPSPHLFWKPIYNTPYGMNGHIGWVTQEEGQRLII